MRRIFLTSTMWQWEWSPPTGWKRRISIPSSGGLQHQLNAKRDQGSASLHGVKRKGSCDQHEFLLCPLWPSPLCLFRQQSFCHPVLQRPWGSILFCLGTIVLCTLFLNFISARWSTETRVSPWCVRPPTTSCPTCRRSSGPPSPPRRPPPMPPLSLLSSAPPPSPTATGPMT